MHGDESTLIQALIRAVYVVEISAISPCLYSVVSNPNKKVRLHEHEQQSAHISTL